MKVQYEGIWAPEPVRTLRRRGKCSAFAAASTFLSTYWKMRYWTFKNKMRATIHLVSNRLKNRKEYCYCSI
jgi:putative flippase GtrA